jgi:hypothetical protein
MLVSPLEENLHPFCQLDNVQLDVQQRNVSCIATKKKKLRNAKRPFQIVFLGMMLFNSISLDILQVDRSDPAFSLQAHMPHGANLIVTYGGP